MHQSDQLSSTHRMVSPLPMTEASNMTTINHRRPHRKSRQGCADCRRRKVKCNEERPRCSACDRRDVPCLYPDVARATSSGPVAYRAANTALGSDLASGRTLPVHLVTPVGGSRSLLANGTDPNCHISPPCSGPSSCSDGLVRASDVPPDWFCMDDMILLHHWTMYTSRTIFKSPNVDHCWQLTFPQIGFRHSFVMHGLLSLAALHLACTDVASRKQRSLDAARHHSAALGGFREGIERMVSEEDYSSSDALFACSILNIVYIFGMSGCHTDVLNGGRSDPRERTARILSGEWIPMIRGIGAVVRPVNERVRLGPLAPLLSLDRWDQLDPDSDVTIQDERFCGVPETWSTLGASDVDIYDKAWRMLRRCHLYTVQFENDFIAAQGLQGLPSEREAGQEGENTYNRQWAGPIAFLHEASDEYLLRVYQRQPPALVIYSYFGALLHNLDDYWFLQRWGRDIVEVVDETLGSYWKPWMKWPREVVGLH
ncbi:hypothetical protein EsH8_X_000022 [Colletotrichum jinshuiense]